MAHLLRDLLDAREPLFSLSLKQLEDATGKQGIDTKLIGDIIEKTHQATRKLGLDHGDTTGHELYRALLAKIKAHDEHLALAIGGKNAEDVQALLPLIKKAVETADVPKSCWVLKRSVAKEMLRNTPPPTIMKLLGYRSIDSMLKHEHLAEIYGALRFAESPEWLNTFNEQYKSLKPSDFETREIEFVVMPLDRWGGIAEHFVAKKRHNITHLKELGVILMLPIKLYTLPGITITAMPLLFHYINEIRLYSAFFKLQQVKKNFGEIFVTTLIADPGKAAVMAGSHVHWRVIQRYFGKLEIYHFRESLWNEIFMRYMGEKTLEQQVLQQLDNDMIAPELL